MARELFSLSGSAPRRQLSYHMMRGQHVQHVSPPTQIPECDSCDALLHRFGDLQQRLLVHLAVDDDLNILFRPG